MAEDKNKMDEGKNTEGEGSDEELGEGGKKALEAERKARREAERKLKEAEASAKANEEAARRLKEAEDADKSEVQKALDRAAAAERAAEKAQAEIAERDQKILRLEIGMAKGLPASMIKRLSGATQEEIEADAAELLEALGATKDDATSSTGKPKERLRSGAAPDKEGEPTAEELIKSIPTIN